MFAAVAVHPAFLVHQSSQFDPAVLSFSIMLSKRSLGCDLVALPPRKRCRANVPDFSLSSTVGGARTQSLLQDAHTAGAHEISEVAKLGAL